MRFRYAITPLAPATVAVLPLVALALVAENIIGHMGDHWSFRGWPLVWQSNTRNSHELQEVHIPWLLLDIAIGCYVMWATTRLTELLFAGRDRWRFSVGSLLVFTAAIAMALAVVRAGAADDALHPAFPLRVLEPAHPWGFGWSDPGVGWMANGALLVALLAGCWSALRLTIALAWRLVERLRPPRPALEASSS